MSTKTMESARSPNEEEEDFEEEEEEDDYDPDEDRRVTSIYAPFEAHLDKIGFEHLNFGSFRSTWIRNRVVIKVPRNRDGIVDNIMEAMAWKKYKFKPTDLGLYLAPCRLLTNNCLMMVTVEDDLDYDDKPIWSHQIDSKQVGTYKNRVVAFDFALDITERYAWEKEKNLRSDFFHHTWLARKPHLKKEKAVRP